MHNETTAFTLKLVTCKVLQAFYFLFLSTLRLVFDFSCSQISHLDYQGNWDYTLNTLFKMLTGQKRNR